MVAFDDPNFRILKIIKMYSRSVEILVCCYFYDFNCDTERVSRFIKNFNNMLSAIYDVYTCQNYDKYTT